MSFKEAEQYEQSTMAGLLISEESPLNYAKYRDIYPQELYRRLRALEIRMPGPKRFRSWNRDRRSAQKSGAIRGQVRWYRPFRRADSSG